MIMSAEDDERFLGPSKRFNSSDRNAFSSASDWPEAPRLEHVLERELGLWLPELGNPTRDEEILSE